MSDGRRWLGCEDGSRVGLVLSGGGARGAFQVGVWKTLLEDPRGLCRTPEVVSGTSCGAINAALIAAGLGPDEMLAFWLAVSEDPPVVANETFFSSLAAAVTRRLLVAPIDRETKSRSRRILGALLRRHSLHRVGGWDALAAAYAMTGRYDAVSSLLQEIPTTFLFDLSPVKAALRRAIGGTEIRHSPVRLAINTVDVATGRVVRIVNFRPEKGPRSSTKHYRYEPAISLDMIMASAAIPLLFNGFEVGGRAMWDGGLLVNSPLAPAVSLGAKRIVPVLVTARPDPAGSPEPTFGWALERVVDTFLENAYSSDRKLLLDRNELALRLPEENLTRVELARPIRPIQGTLVHVGSYLYFERRALLAMHAAGQEAARRWLDAGPELDSRRRSEA